jgi:DNA-directed RNA polymerase III subunit RPC4
VEDEAVEGTWVPRPLDQEPFLLVLRYQVSLQNVFLSQGLTFAEQTPRGKAYPRPWAPSGTRGDSSSRLPGLGSAEGIKGEDGVVKRESATAQKKAAAMLYSGDVKREGDDGGYISSDPDDTGQGPRKDIADIAFVDLTSDNEDGPGGERRLTNRFNSPAQPPVRIHRVEHRERAPALNPNVADSSVKRQADDDVMEIDEPVSSIKQGKQKVNEVEVVTASRRWKGVYPDEEELDVKDEPMEEDATATPIEIARPARGDITKDTKPKRTHKTGHKNPKVFLQTEEEFAELQRYEDDLELLVSELGQVGPTGESVAAESSETTTAPTISGADQKADRVYLFQLPPVVPDLIVPVPIIIKDEPMEVPAPATEPSAHPDNEIVPAQRDPLAIIKIEDDKLGAVTRPAHLPTLASGIAGKLRVHKSGKVTLNWGGTSLQVNKGMDSNFLQDIVLVKEGSEERQTGAIRPIPGDALAFGQVRGKFVVTPDWEEVLK